MTRENNKNKNFLNILLFQVLKKNILKTTKG